MLLFTIFGQGLADHLLVFRTSVIDDFQGHVKKMDFEYTIFRGHEPSFNDFRRPLNNVFHSLSMI